MRNNLESSSSLDPLAISSSSSSERFSFGELIDERDGQVYKTIVIADSTRSQTWMAENLNFDYPVNPPKTDVNNYNDTTKVLKKYGYETKKKKVNGKVVQVIELPYKKWNGTLNS